MAFFLRWILPPLVGAVIGYVTNALAIKMLFRPLTEKRIFGVRIPFTPGILPRERHALAVSLGDVVADDLLTEEVLRTRFESPELREGVAASLRAVLDDFLETPVSQVRSEARAAGPILSEAADRAYKAVSGTDAFRNAASAAARKAFREAESLRVGEILAPRGRSLLAEWFRQPGRPEFTSEKAGAAVLRALRKAAEEGKSLGAMLPLQNLSRVAEAAFDAAYPGALSAVHRFLARPDVRKELERYGGSIVRRAIGRLPTLQRILVGAAQYERALLESMPATVSDLTEAAESFLSSEKTVTRLKTALLDTVQGAVETPLASRLPGSPLSPEGLSALARRAVRAIGERKASEEEKSDILGESTLGDILDSLGPEARLGISEALGAWLSGFFAPGSGGRVVGALASAFSVELLEGLGETPVGTAAGWDAGFRDRLARYLAEEGTRVAARESSRILRSLDLRRVVIEKVDGLDVLAIERIMLRVMSKEFRGITVLGGFLGALIGAIQLVVDLIRP